MILYLFVMLLNMHMHEHSHFAAPKKKQTFMLWKIFYFNNTEKQIAYLLAP